MINAADRYIQTGNYQKAEEMAGKFVESRPGRTCIIGSLEKAAEAIAGLSGTRIHL